MNRKLILILLAAAMMAWIVVPASATKLQHRNVAEMSKIADKIFVGTCTEAVYEETPLNETVNMSAMRYTFDVLEDVKGNLDATVTVRHLGSVEGTGMVPGMPAYAPGVKYLIFMLPDSNIGLTSPVGLFQGAFEIGGDIQQKGDATVLNANNNVGVFHNVTEQQLGALALNEKQLRMIRRTSKGAIDYHDFLDLVRKMSN